MSINGMNKISAVMELDRYSDRIDRCIKFRYIAK